jgi:hypothetical protein
MIYNVLPTHERKNPIDKNAGDTTKDRAGGRRAWNRSYNARKGV